MVFHAAGRLGRVAENKHPARASRYRRAIQLPAIRSESNDWYGRFRNEQTLSNDFLIDREAQRNNEGPAGFTGITGIAMQDAAMTTSMGGIMDRSKERLGSTDAMVIRVRRRMIAAVQAHMRSGQSSPAWTTPEVYRVRSGASCSPRRRRGEATASSVTLRRARSRIHHNGLSKRKYSRPHRSGSGEPCGPPPPFGSSCLAARLFRGDPRTC